MPFFEACKILDVGPDLGRADLVKDATHKRKKLALIYHPDRNPSADATEVMQRINRAFESVKEGPQR